MNKNVEKYLNQYEVVPANTPQGKIVYVPYKEEVKVSKYLKKYEVVFKIRYSWNYDTAIFCI